MITALQAEQFKSWANTGRIRMAPITGLFGTNSSGKTSILQLLLLLKQTVESADRQRVLHTGDERTYTDLGTFFDIIHAHQIPNTLTISVAWKLAKNLQILDPTDEKRSLFSIPELHFFTTIKGLDEEISVERFEYAFHTNPQHAYRFGMVQQPNQKYDVVFEGYELKRTRGRPTGLPAPIKCYGFPDQVNAYYQNASFLADFVLAFEELFNNIFYLGPLREYPQRNYTWSGQRPQDVGRRGELAIAAMLASRERTIKVGKGNRPTKTLEERVAQWMRDLGLIHDFAVRPIAENRKSYEVRIRLTARSPEVLITDVGFGVSQILPVIVLCYYAPEGATIILEQPEIHLHPQVQAGLADIFIDAINTRNVQIILESHSEHLLRRLQRRIAEGALAPEQAALYFCTVNRQGTSHLQPLELDQYGNITNWPDNFFGDEFGEIAAMQEAAIKRQLGS